MIRWKVSVTWHEGSDGASWAVESYKGSERLSCITAEVDMVDDTQRRLALFAWLLKEGVEPQLFPDVPPRFARYI